MKHILLTVMLAFSAWASAAPIVLEDGRYEWDKGTKCAVDMQTDSVTGQLYEVYTCGPFELYGKMRQFPPGIWPYDRTSDNEFVSITPYTMTEKTLKVCPDKITQERPCGLRQILYAKDGARLTEVGDVHTMTHRIYLINTHSYFHQTEDVWTRNGQEYGRVKSSKILRVKLQKRSEK